MFTNNLQSKRSDADKKQNNTYQVPNCLLKHKTEVVTIIWIAKRLLLRAFNFGTKIYTIWFIMYFIFLCLHLRCVDISTIHGFVYHETKKYILVVLTCNRNHVLTEFIVSWTLNPRKKAWKCLTYMYRYCT